MNPISRELMEELFTAKPELIVCQSEFIRAYEVIVDCFEQDGTLFTCGNGGSFADAIHIAGELVKSFERKRPICSTFAERLAGEYEGVQLAQYLESGFRTMPLGLNGSLKTAIENDCPMRDIAFAQELSVFIRPGDVLLAISTSGNAKNCLYAVSVAHAKCGKTIGLTGSSGGLLAKHAQVCIKVPAVQTKTVQEYHQSLWHTLCAMIEAHFFPEKRG